MSRGAVKLLCLAMLAFPDYLMHSFGLDYADVSPLLFMA